MVHVVLAGGGSAGHTSPLIATAERLVEQGATVSAVGTAEGLEVSVVPAAGIELDLIGKVPFPRRPNLDAVKFPGRLVAAITAAGEILKRRCPDVVVGFGGYASTPVYLAAFRAKVPVVVHEQNAIAGLANRLGARKAEFVAVTYPNTALPRATVVGLPMRASITNLAALDETGRRQARAKARAKLGLPVDRPTLLVSGGSLGARSINRAVLTGLDDLLAVRGGLDIVHVWGKQNFPEAPAPRAAADGRGAYLPLPYVGAMETAYAAADLMLCRAGSNTVNEVAAIGLPAIFVPLPIGNGEQGRNASALVEAGGGRLVVDADLSPERLLAEVMAASEPELLARTSAVARHVPADAAERMAREVLRVAGATTSGVTR